MKQTHRKLSDTEQETLRFLRKYKTTLMMLGNIAIFGEANAYREWKREKCREIPKRVALNLCDEGYIVPVSNQNLSRVYKLIRERF